MTREARWQIYCKNNPGLLKGTPTFSVAGIKRFYDTTYKAAHGEGFDSGYLRGLQERDGVRAFHDLMAGMEK